MCIFNQLPQTLTSIFYNFHLLLLVNSMGKQKHVFNQGGSFTLVRLQIFEETGLWPPGNNASNIDILFLATQDPLQFASERKQQGWEKISLRTGFHPWVVDAEEQKWSKV